MQNEGALFSLVRKSGKTTQEKEKRFDGSAAHLHATPLYSHAIVFLRSTEVYTSTLALVSRRSSLLCACSICCSNNRTSFWFHNILFLFFLFSFRVVMAIWEKVEKKNSSKWKSTRKRS
ncbi:hypothetical protein VIN7_8703 [Saccharomyces cerevisiae x Saccharomyces kudriavzevii VIN7]|uniref:Transmembrane protein n=1 Tax=Saccharomyces cerevisiae x Saccharomyces kudriavzevii (strain VIN7) TaxID=1095631 RepID=H0GYB4_SACCK|nr:hypothetical protein VIN7_8703 [Saccharomyces cerevisiae x Saccharomyces kudriavzevii VIN7]